MPPRQDEQPRQRRNTKQLFSRSQSDWSDSVRTIDLNADTDGASSYLDLNETTDEQEHSHTHLPNGMLSPTVSLPLLNFIDMFSVSLVIPFLFQYYKHAGVTSANQRELLSSVFSASQIVGGVVLGAMTDAKLVKRKTILFLSFGGSSLSYALIAFGGFRSLVFSRILVGLVKQTKTVTTSIMTNCTTYETRVKYMGRLESSSTAAWILGPTVGALLYKYVGHQAPALLASLLFLLNLAFAAVLLREPPGLAPGRSVLEPENAPASKASNKEQGKSDFWTNLRGCFRSKVLGAVIASILIFSWVDRATSYANMGSYYEDMYGMEPYHRGYIQSYQRILAFIVQSVLVHVLMVKMGGERRATCWSALLLALATFLEIRQSILIFVVALSPVISLSTTIMNVSLRSLLTYVAPEQSIFSVFAVLDVLQSATAVTVPFYRTVLFRILGENSPSGTNTMIGDPNPVSWVFSSGVHWLFAGLAMVYLLRPPWPEALRAKTTKQV